MLNALKLGMAGGILWSFSLLIITIISIYTGYASPVLNLLTTVYPGYTISWVGALIGFIYGFIDAFVGLFLFGWIYNKL